MRKSAIVLLSIVSLLAGGCGMFRKATPEPVTGNPIQRNTVQGEGMTLTVELPTRRLEAGRDVNLRIIARSTSESPIAFQSPTLALYTARIYRMSANGWSQIDQFPQADMNVRKDWTLLPGQIVKYDQIIRAGRDWPMDETLRMVVELNGGPVLKCPIAVSATAGKQD